jgi:hypothetical protein
MNAYDFFHKYFDLEYWISTGVRVREDDGIIEIFVKTESEGQVLEMVLDLNEGDFQR